MVSDDQPQEFVATVRWAEVWNDALVLAAIGVVGFGVLIAPMAITFYREMVAPVPGNTIVDVFVLTVLCAGVLALGTWVNRRGLTRSTFTIGTTGMHVRTPRGSWEVDWSDITAVTVATENDKHPLLASLRPGVRAPIPTEIGAPKWSDERRCLIVIWVESFETTPADVNEALRRYAGDTYHADGRL
jgi:hypothetical protein